MVAIVFIQWDGLELLLAIAADLVVEHRIHVHLDAGGAAGADGTNVVVFGAVFGADAAFLVELPEIKQVVDCIAHILVAGHAFVGRWEPDGRDANARQIGGFLFKALPVFAVCFGVPMEPLHHRSIELTHVLLGEQHR